MPVRVIEVHADLRYDPAELASVLVNVDLPPSGSAMLADLPADLPLVQLTSLRISHRMKSLIHLGQGPDYPTRYATRSEAVFAVIQALISATYDDATIAAVLLHPDHGISAKPREQGQKLASPQEVVANAAMRTSLMVTWYGEPPETSRSSPAQGTGTASGRRS